MNRTIDLACVRGGSFPVDHEKWLGDPHTAIVIAELKERLVDALSNVPVNRLDAHQAVLLLGNVCGAAAQLRQVESLHTERKHEEAAETYGAERGEETDA